MWWTGWTKGCRYRSQTTHWPVTSSLGTTTAWGTMRTGRSNGCPWRPSSTSASLRPVTWWVHDLAAWLGLWLVGCDGVLVGWLVVEVFCQWCGKCVGDVVGDLSAWLWLWLIAFFGIVVGSGSLCRWCGEWRHCLTVTVWLVVWLVVVSDVIAWL